MIGTISMIFVQDYFWGENDTVTKFRPFKKLQGTLVAVAIVIGMIFAFFPSESFIDDTIEQPFYIVPKTITTGIEQ